MVNMVENGEKFYLLSIVVLTNYNKEIVGNFWWELEINNKNKEITTSATTKRENPIEAIQTAKDHFEVFMNSAQFSCP